MTNMATICILPPQLSYMRAEAELRETNNNYLAIECVQIHITDRETGGKADCNFDPLGLDGFNVVFGAASQFTKIISEG